VAGERPLNTTNLLGTFSVQNTGWESYNFVPLRDDSGNLITLTFDGSTNTLQLGNPLGSGSDVNVNFLMLTPVFSMTATSSGTNVALSFPSQSGFSYQVQYKTNLTDPNWSALGSARRRGPMRPSSSVILAHEDKSFLQSASAISNYLVETGFPAAGPACCWKIGLTVVIHLATIELSNYE